MVRLPTQGGQGRTCLGPPEGRVLDGASTASGFVCIGIDCCCMMPPLIIDRGDWKAALRASAGVLEQAAIEQLAFEGCEETLGTSRCRTRPRPSHRGAHARIAAAAAVRVLRRSRHVAGCRNKTVPKGRWHATSGFPAVSEATVRPVSLIAEREEIALLRVQAAPCRRLRAGSANSLNDLAGSCGAKPRRTPLYPRMITAGGDAQHSAHRGDRIVGLVIAHEPEPSVGSRSSPERTGPRL